MQDWQMMRLYQDHIRGTSVGSVDEAGLRALAAVLTHRPLELLLNGQGAAIVPQAPGRPRQRIQDGGSVAVALAKRNIRSLLCQSRDSEEVTEALRTALIGDPREAEEALEDACLEVNLRYGIFAAPDAALFVQDRVLVISDGSPTEVHIARRDLRNGAGEFFCPGALNRLQALDVEEIHLSAGAIQPRWMQLEPGAVMLPDTAHRHLRKGGWRALRRVDFIKAFCVACGRCFVHCPDSAVIHSTYDRNARQSSGILGIDSERCTACGLCAAVCPTNRDGYKAIVMIAAEAESSPRLHCVG